jgi:hypothetical protein
VVGGMGHSSHRSDDQRDSHDCQPPRWVADIERVTCSPQHVVIEGACIHALVLDPVGPWLHYTFWVSQFVILHFDMNPGWQQDCYAKYCIKNLCFEATFMLWFHHCQEVFQKLV